MELQNMIRQIENAKKLLDDDGWTDYSIIIDDFVLINFDEMRNKAYIYLNLYAVKQKEKTTTGKTVSVITGSRFNQKKVFSYLEHVSKNYDTILIR